MAGYTSILNYIKNLPAGTLPTLDEARSQYNQCFAELENFKTAGICLKCDGNASEFYDATDQTYKVKPDNCTKLVQACHKIFAFYSTLNTLNHIFISVNRAIVAKKAGNTTFTPSGLGGGLSLTQLTSLLTCSDDFAKCQTDTPHFIDHICRFVSLDADNAIIEPASTTVATVTTAVTETAALAAVSNPAACTAVGSPTAAGSRFTSAFYATQVTGTDSIVCQDANNETTTTFCNENTIKSGDYNDGNAAARYGYHPCKEGYGTATALPPACTAFSLLPLKEVGSPPLSTPPR